ncbi:hypothetical protein HK097_003265 [Rhizophlyctis rosea]|uniref:Uncharacterized protein n=1 Tax=Rhizophlyctis rosea TaxID=64517 RepID=A0AAD5S2S7_9FUNG|nr:hypothetical protein HK097_003265 [Rhizophlyctis rosea]
MGGVPGAVRGSQVLDGTGSEFTKDELLAVRDWSYWRVRLRKDDLILEGVEGARYEISPQTGSADRYQLISKTPAPEHPPAEPEIIAESDLRLTSRGLRLKHKSQTIEVLRFFWRKRRSEAGPTADQTNQPAPMAIDEEEEEEVVAEGTVPGHV